MSIRPTAFHNDGTFTVVHDDPGYGCIGTVKLADLEHAIHPLGHADPFWLVIHCPKGDGTTLHPASGGADPEMVQELFIRKEQQKKLSTWEEAKAVIKAHCEAHGEGHRWKHDHTIDPFF